MDRRFLACLTVAAMTWFAGDWLGVHAETVGALNSTLTPAQTVYECRKTDETITIDGRLDERAWQRAPHA